MILDLFAGPGGWDEGLRMVGRTDVVGLEWDEDACATAEAAGHRRECVDVATADPANYDGIEGLIASPPCPSFSAAGSHKGLDDPRGLLTNEPIRWALALRPDWIAWEQVPAVLPIWQDFGATLRGCGYSVLTQVVDAADYGASQIRKRAVLVAQRKDRGFVQLPEVTHGGVRNPHVTMHQGIGWGLTKRPATTVVATSSGGPRALDGGNGARKIYRDAVASGDWVESPHAAAGLAPWYVSEVEAAQLQTFRADYPWHGSTKAARFRQIGNAVPPLLAAHILAALSVGELEATMERGAA